MKVPRVIMAAGTALALSLLLASAALASGPATSHRAILTGDCGGGVTYIIAVVIGGQNVGVAQVVDQFGHAIYVSGTSVVTDTTQGGKLIATYDSGHGSGHDNQTQTTCQAIVKFQVTAADVSGRFFPPWVQVGDWIRDEISVTAVWKV